MFGVLRPIDWLKIYPNLVVFFVLLFFYFLYILSFRALKNFSSSRKAMEITIQCKYEVAQYYWLSLCFTLSNTKLISCFHVSSWKQFSMSLFFLSFLVSALLFIFIIYIFLNLGVWDPKLTNLKLGDRPQLWPVLPLAFSLSKVVARTFFC